VGRLTGEKSLNFGFPIRDGSDRLRRVLFASLKIDLLTQAAQNSDLPEAAVATILDRNGTILARVPSGDQWVGRTLPDAALVRDVLQAREGAVASVGLDGIRRIYAITSISDDSGPAIFVAVGVPTSVLFATADRTLKRNMLGASLILLGALFVSSTFAQRLFVKPIQELSQAANRIAGGDLTARTKQENSTAEIARLATAFNSMAAKLEQRDAELERARLEIQNMNLELEKRVQERTSQLSAANQELESFSYSVSHDLRAPLRHIDGFAEMLRKSQSERLDEKGRRYLDVISEAARKMGTLIDELLVFSRMGRQELLKSPINMRAVVQEAIAQLEPEHAQRNIEWIISDLRQVEADPAMLRQVWINLISNAVKYTRGLARARIEIGSYDIATEHVFFIRDNGVGFDMKYADKLFGVFQRLHSEREFEGTGIGLANVKRIIARHGGRTWAESQPGKGSSFYFSLIKNE
jgi:signal transduction histidine kinase